MKTLFLALCAVAAIMTGTLDQAAARVHAGVVTISIDGFCNVEKITIGKGAIINTIAETDDCDDNYGVGTYTKIRGVGLFANFGFTSANSPGLSYDMVFAKPFATDGTGQVSFLYTLDGVTQNVIGPYTYEVVTGDAKPNKTGLKPVSSLFPRK
jgi:hypothetical protein